VSLVTVNYDDPLEKALAEEGLAPAPIAAKGEVPAADEVPVYHLHGRIDDSHPQGPVALPEDDYARFPVGECWQDELMKSRLRDSMCVFVGLSFTDPTLLRWLHTAGNGGPQHVALFSRQSSPLLEEEIRRDLEDATRARWHDAEIDAHFTGSFGERRKSCMRRRWKTGLATTRILRESRSRTRASACVLWL
jgi:hypothetical protein